MRYAAISTAAGYAGSELGTSTLIRVPAVSARHATSSGPGPAASRGCLKPGAHLPRTGPLALHSARPSTRGFQMDSNTQSLRQNRMEELAMIGFLVSAFVVLVIMLLIQGDRTVAALITAALAAACFVYAAALRSRIQVQQEGEHAVGPPFNSWSTQPHEVVDSLSSTSHGTRRDLISLTSLWTSTSP